MLAGCINNGGQRSDGGNGPVDLAAPVVAALRWMKESGIVGQLEM